MARRTIFWRDGLQNREDIKALIPALLQHFYGWARPVPGARRRHRDVLDGLLLLLDLGDHLCTIPSRRKSYATQHTVSH
jgi:hypothetical protein